jgi:hypothetical protein
VEEEQNQKRLRDNHRMAVTFGSQVSFRHMDSHYYLTSEMDSSATLVSGFQCQMRHHYSKSAVFELTSLYRSKRRGDVINLSNTIVIRSAFNNCYLNWERGSPLANYLHRLPAQEDRLRPVGYPIDPHCSIHLAFFANEARDNGWNFELFACADRNDDIKLLNPIKGLDLVLLHHPELKAELTADVVYTDKHPDAYLRRYVGINSTEKISINSLWQIEHLEIFSYGSQFRALQNNEDVISSKVTSEQFRLRHFVSGRLLHLSFKKDADHVMKNNLILKRESTPTPKEGKDNDELPNFEDSESHKELNMSENFDNEYTDSHRFNLEFIIMEEKALKEKSLVYLQSNGTLLPNTGLNLKCQEQLFLLNATKPTGIEALKKMSPLGNYDMEEEKKVSSSSDSLSPSQMKLATKTLCPSKGFPNIICRRSSMFARLFSTCFSSIG